MDYGLFDNGAMSKLHSQSLVHWPIRVLDARSRCEFTALGRIYLSRRQRQRINLRSFTPAEACDVDIHLLELANRNREKDDSFGHI